MCSKAEIRELPHHMQTLAPVAAPEIVVLTTHGATSDDKARSMTTPRALDEGEL